MSITTNELVFYSHSQINYIIITIIQVEKQINPIVTNID